MERLSHRLYGIKLSAEILSVNFQDRFPGESSPKFLGLIRKMHEQLENLEEEAKLAEISPGLPLFKDSL
jgi:hypothetical protein